MEQNVHARMEAGSAHTQYSDTPARLITVVAPRTAEAHWLGLKACTRGYGSFEATALGSLVSTLTVCPTAVSFETSRLPTRPVAPAGMALRPG